MLYSSEDVEELKKRAHVLAMLTRSDNVTPEQLQLLKKMHDSESRLNAANVPALAHYRAFLESLVATQQAERAAEAERHADLARKVDALRQKNATLEEAARSRREVDAAQAQAAALQERAQRAREEAEVAKSKLVATEEAMAKLNVDVDISAMVERDKALALQRVELESLEKQYLEAEQSTFALHRDIRTVGEGNAELLRICTDLMQRIENVKK